MSDSMVKIDVTNMSSHATIRSGSYSMKVPFSSLSRTMQFIHRSGGKVVKVTKLSATASLAELPPIATPVYTSTSTANPQSQTATAVRTEPQATQDRSKRGSKQNKR
jgi:CpcD/allophycocyanin linker domain